MNNNNNNNPVGIKCNICQGDSLSPLLFCLAVIEHLYLPRSEGARGLVSIEDCVNNEREILSLYAPWSNEKLIIAATTELKLKKFVNVHDRQERRKQCLIEWKEKALHGQFLRETESTDDRNRWEWLKRGELKRETEILLRAAQEQALRVNAIKYSIDKTHDTPLCRLCNEKTEMKHTLWVSAQFWLKVNTENAIRLEPTCTGCCVRRSLTMQWQVVHTQTTINPGQWWI